MKSYRTKNIPDIQQQQIIGREVTIDMSREIFDTRIVPGEILQIPFKWVIPNNKVYFKAVVTVEPDHFYERFYKTLLLRPNNPKSRKLLEQAFATAREPAFTIFERTIPLFDSMGR